jgi:hypothetical protein
MVFLAGRHRLGPPVRQLELDTVPDHHPAIRGCRSPRFFEYEPDAIDRFATLAAGTQTPEEAGSSAARTGRERK